MKIAELRSIINYGGYAAFYANKDHEDRTWSITVEGGDRPKTLHTDRGQIRKFKTLDAVVKTAESLGIGHLSVDLSGSKRKMEKALEATRNITS